MLSYVTPPPTIQELSGNGGNCMYNWYNPDLSITAVSGFSDQVSCNNAIEVAKQNNSSSDTGGNWLPFFNGDSKILYTYGGKCISVDSDGNVITSSVCTKNSTTNHPWYWIITPEKDTNNIATGHYFVTNQSTGQYLSVPESASTATLTTSSTPTTVGIKLTYPTFGNQVSTNKLKPTSYYFHFTNPNVDQTCAYTNNFIVQTVSWSSNTGLVSGYPLAPEEQQQRQVMYECGKDPNKFTTTDAVYNTPNPNYQFTVDRYCLSDFYNVCFHDDGSLIN